MVTKQSILSSNNTILNLTKSEKNNFKITLNQNQTTNFYGHTITPFEAIVMRGIMPDNNIASLKLLKCVGDQLAFLERQEAEDAKKANPENPNIDTYYQSLPSRIANTRQVDKAVNAHTAMVLRVMGKLDQMKNRTMPPDERTTLAAELTQVYNDTINYIKSIKDGQKDSLVVRRCDVVIKELKSQLQSVQLDPVFIDKEGEVSTKVHQRLFRTVLRQYESLEGVVSAWDGVKLNRSCTEAYQDASIALQNHVYSPQIPDAAQLWQLPNTGMATLDTALYGDYFERDKLLFTLGVGDTDPLCKFEDNAQKLHKRQKEDKEKPPSKKEAIVKKNNDVDLSGFKHDLHVQIKIHKETYPDSVMTEEAMSEILNKAFNQSLGDYAYTIDPARPLHIHEVTDLYSMIGRSAEGMSSYFAQEMAAKHPGLTFAFFSLTAATLGASALVATHTLTHVASQYLQIVGDLFHKASGGKVSASAVQQALLAVEKQWITFSHATTFTQRLFMDVITLPTITYMMSELLLTSRLDKSTWSNVTEQFKSDALLYTTDEEKMMEDLIQAATVVFGLGMTAASGILMSYIMTLPVLQGSSGIQLPSFFPDIIPETFTKITTDSDLSLGLIGVVSAVFAVKIKDLVGDKMVDVGKQLFKKNDDPAIVECLNMLIVLHRLYLDDPLSFNKVKAAMEELETLRPGMWKAIQSSANQLKKQRPALVKDMNPSFWDALNGVTPGEPVKINDSAVTVSSSATQKVGLLRRVSDAIGRFILWGFGPLVGAVYTLVMNPIATAIAWLGFRLGGKPRTFKQLFNDDIFSPEMTYQAAKLGKALSGVVNFVWYVIKMLGNSSYRTVFLGLKSLVTAIAFTVLCINAMTNGKIRQGVGALLGQIGSMVLRGLLRVVLGLAKGILGLCRGLTVGIMAIVPTIISIGLLPFAVVALGRGIASAFRAVVKNEPVLVAFKEGFSSSFNNGKAKQLQYFVVDGFIWIKNKTAFLGKFSAAISESIYKRRQALHFREERVETALFVNLGAAGIMSARDTVLSGLNTAQAFGKNTVGQVLHYIRTLFVRSMEEEIQQYGFNVKDKTSDVIVTNARTSAALIHSMIGPPSSRMKKDAIKAAGLEEKKVSDPATQKDNVSPQSPRSNFS